MPSHDTDTTPRAHDYQEYVAEQTREQQPRSALGDGQCPQCGRPPWICDGGVDCWEYDPDEYEILMAGA